MTPQLRFKFVFCQNNLMSLLVASAQAAEEAQISSVEHSLEQTNFTLRDSNCFTCVHDKTCPMLSHGSAPQDSKLNHVWIWLTGFKLSVRLTTGVSSAFPMPPPHHDAKKLLRVLVRLLCWKKRLLIVLNGFNTGHLWAGACALRAACLVYCLPWYSVNDG